MTSPPAMRQHGPKRVAPSRGRPWFRFELLALALLAAPFVARASDGGTSTTCALDVKVTGLRAGGSAWVLLFSSADPKAFPTRREAALRRTDRPVVGPSVSVSFDQLPCGDYAVAVVHDLNGDGVVATNFLGIPQEGLGASRNAKRMFGPPRFEDAKLTIQPGRTEVPILLSY